MVLSMERWIGKVAIVTGASSGIGAAIAKKLVQTGLIVVGLARRKEKIEELGENLKNEKGKLLALKCDVSKEADILAAFKWIKENLGPVHVLINNAGTIIHSPLMSGETEKWQQVFNVNVIGLCIATREAIKDMLENKIDGHIVHINSVAGHKVPSFPFNVYPASKYSITALTDSLRFELNQAKSKIKVTSLSPGYVATEIMTPESQKFFVDEPFLNPEDIADGIEYVLSTPPHVQIRELTIKPVNEEF